MIVNRLVKQAKKLQLQQIQKAAFGHGAHKPYDWRDDPKFNSDLTQDCRDRGWNPEEYAFPYNKAHDDWYFPQQPDSYKSQSLSQNLRPEYKISTENFNTMPASYSSYDADVAHEYDYESEDLDFQCESFEMQHFRKKGPISQWIILGFLPLIYFYLDFMYQHAPDEDYWRCPMPPPLNYPDPEDTDDTLTMQDYESRYGHYLVDSGIVDPIWYDIVDGKKVYKRFAGVNQPMADI
ncbi:hypothetical protein PPERSA_06772 [Pseudocohnilembus persalinus]|uniref:Uncharacterized protein n=1 Tax=Pseudocohnilembus persalinus TaxID=266149 RepID=A0A0V0QS41_PSEPJ|nr:hypothetical protein PPERSA_06772 [Pseudocohnilembus persalinus]|eukprot:KRX05138.1 hypothetical protein PPERSA_06772 [Pseudocohnilembus persalinus]